MEFIFQIEPQLFMKNVGLPLPPLPQPQTQLSFWISKAIILLFLHSRKLCKNFSELVDTLSLKKSEVFFGPFRDMQNVCAVAKGGTVASGP